MLVSIVIDADLEIDASHIEVVPPVPCDLAGLHPAEIAFGSVAEAIYDVIIHHLDILGADGEDAPGELFTRIALCQIVVAALDHLLDIVVSSLLQIFRQGSPHAVQLAGAVTLQVHAGVVVQRRFHDVDLDTLGCVYHLRQVGQLFRVDCAQGRILINILKRGFKLVPGESGPGVPVSGKVKLRSLALNLEGLLALGNKAVCDAIVVCAENNVAILITQRHFIIVVANFGALVCYGPEGFVCAAS